MDVNALLFGCVHGGFLSYFRGFGSLVTNFTTKAVELTHTTVTIGHLLGEGGQANVYLAHDERGKQYALKVLTCSPERAEAMKAELDTMARNLGPTLMPMLDGKEVTARHPNERRLAYILMPYYADGSLWDVVHARKDNPLSSSEMLAILSQVTDALVCLHEAGLVHRDVKPHNVMLQTAASGQSLSPRAPHFRYQCVLGDLGSCCRMEDLRVTSMADAMKLQALSEDACSPLYRCPELNNVPHRGQLDGRVDIWALGCLLYFMMTGINPFEHQVNQGASLPLAIHRAKVAWDPHPPRALNPDLQELVHSCLRPNYVDRPTAADVQRWIHEHEASISRSASMS